jgi:hypothetical protein
MKGPMSLNQASLTFGVQSSTIEPPKARCINQVTASAISPLNACSQRAINSAKSPVKTAQERLALASANVERDTAQAPI